MDYMNDEYAGISVRKYPVSIFHYENDSKIEKTTIKGRADNISSPGEKPLATALYKYGFMNLDVMKKNIANTGHKRLDVAKTLEKMQKQGKVEKYTVWHGGDRANLDIYTLTSEFEETLGKSRDSIYKKDMKDIPYILENLALCQWHNSLLSSIRASTEIMYNQTKCCTCGFVVVPSVIRIKVGKCGVHLCAVPVNRNNHLKNLKNFVVNLVRLNRYFEENQGKYRSYLIVLLCESVSQIEDLVKLLSVMKETKEMDLLYTIDMATYSGEPLDSIFRVERTLGRADLSLVRL